MKSGLIAALRGMAVALVSFLCLSSTAAEAASVQLVSIKCLDTADWDGDDEVYLEAEVTGDLDSDIIWGSTYMDTTSTHNTKSLYSVGPIACESSTFCKGIAVWDMGGDGLFDVQEQIGVVFVYPTPGTYTATVSGADARYEVTYTVQ